MLSKIYLAFIFVIAPLALAAQAQDGSRSSQQLVQEINAYMARLETQGFSGGVTVFKDGGVLMAEGYGMANREAGTPFTNTTVFTIGSVTKQFTGAAIMKLVMAGKMEVDNLISEYFEGVPADKAGITVHHLLTHSAGLPEAIGFDFAPIEWGDYLAKGLEADLRFTPGSGYGYSNVGFSFLAAIVERISGQSYTDFVRSELFEPAGMNQTGYDLAAFEPGNMAHGYRQGKDWGSFADKTWAPDGPYWHLRGNGGMLSTLNDMMKWHIALLGDKILSEQAKAAYFAPHVLEGEGAKSSYGYGWVNQQTPRGLLIWHDGGNPYFNTEFRRYVDAGVAILVHSNSAEYRSSRIIAPISNIVFGDPYELPPLQITEIDPADLGGSPEGRRAEALVHMFSGQESDVDDFIATHLSPALLERNPAARMKQMFVDDQSRIGAVEIAQVLRQGPRKLELIIRSVEGGDWRSLTVSVAAGAPHRIIGIELDMAQAPAGFDSAMSSDSDREISGRDWGVPDGPGGRVIAKFLDAVTSGSIDVHRGYIETEFAEEFRTYFPMADHIDQFAQMYLDLGDNPELVGANRPDANTVVAQIRAPGVGDITITFDVDADYKVMGISFD